MPAKNKSMPAAQKKKIAKAQAGKSNSNWKGGESQGYLRKKLNAKKGDIVHHTKNGSVEKVSASEHEKIHRRRSKSAPKGFPKGTYTKK